MPMRNRVFTLVIVFLVATVTISLKSAKAGTQTIIPAIADTYVDNANPEANFGDSLFLFTHYYSESVAEASAGTSSQNEVGPVAHTFLKFDLSQIPPQASISEATLRLHTAMWGTRSNNKVGVFLCEDTWTESGITWNNVPLELSSIPIDTLECADPDMDYNFDLSSTIGGKDSITLMLSTLEFSKMPAVFNSVDLNPDKGPTLIVEYSVPIDTWWLGAAGLGFAAIGAVFVALVLRSKRRNARKLESSHSAHCNPKTLFSNFQGY